MSNLVFISNELLDPRIARTMRIPWEFISFAHIKGKMYDHFRNQGTFVLDKGRAWGNRVVYGALFAMPDFDFHIRVIDSYHQCSRSLLAQNHVNDVHHRHIVDCTPITFSTIDELERLQYKERTTIPAHAYFGNTNHSRINQRLITTANYRIVDGIDKHFISLYREVKE